MDRNQKFLKRLSQKEFNTVQTTLFKIKSVDTSGLDIKKLSGYSDVFRVRIGDIRMIFLSDGKNIEILEISRKSEKTYKNF